MKLKANLPDGSYSVPARYMNSSAAVNVDVTVTDGHVTVSQEVGNALLAHDKDTNAGRFEHVSDEMPTEEPIDFRNIQSVEPPSESGQDAQEGAEAGADAEPSTEGGEQGGEGDQAASTKAKRGGK